METMLGVWERWWIGREGRKVILRIGMNFLQWYSIGILLKELDVTKVIYVYENSIC